MAEGQSPISTNRSLPVDFDVHSPNFGRDMLEWSLQAISEMHQTITATHETIATSKALMAEADRILSKS